MIREEKIKAAIKKGITCNINTGKIYGVKGSIIGSVKNSGYEVFVYRNNNKIYYIKTHQFIFYISNGYLPDMIDHKDRDKLNNSISNLRDVTRRDNTINTDRVDRALGYTKHKCGKYSVFYSGKYYGLYSCKEEAHQAYLDAKKIYHNI